jgi:hypothetical protein
MSVEILTYAGLAARFKISPEAARGLARRLRLPRSLSNDGKALVSIDLAEIRHTPRSPLNTPLKTKIETLQAEIARLDAVAAGHRADFERERDRADRLMVELLKATNQTLTAKEVTARLEGELVALRSSVEADGRAVAGRGSVSRVRRLAAALVETDRRTCR